MPYKYMYSYISNHICILEMFQNPVSAGSKISGSGASLMFTLIQIKYTQYSVVVFELDSNKFSS